MKIGKLPESVLKRSVFKQIHTRRPEVVLGAGVGEDCAAIKLAEDRSDYRNGEGHRDTCDPDYSE